MMPYFRVLLVISTGTLGLLVGALLIEGFVLVPYWRSLPADAFFGMRNDFGPRLYRFFAPLTAVATSLTIVAALIATFWFPLTAPGRWPIGVTGILSLVLVGVYGLYFKSANAAFAAGRLSPAELSGELERWARWHWIRVAAGMVALVTSLMGLAEDWR